jgi:putative MFS transporter
MSNAGHIYQLEQFPTSVRTTATGWLYSLSRLSTAAAPFYLIPLLDAYGGGAVFAAVAVAMLLAAFAVAFGVRATGLSVEEISRASDGADRPAPSIGRTARISAGPSSEMR